MSTGSVAEPLPEAEAMARVLGLWTGAQSLRLQSQISVSSLQLRAHNQLSHAQAGSAFTESPLEAHKVKNPPAMRETWIQPLEEGMATHSSILAWRIP